MQATRRQILDHLRLHDQATVKELGRLLGLTPTGIRQHLTVLERDGMVVAHEERGHVGRPALAYRLTEQGDALYPKLYDSLANVLLNELRGIAGPDSLQRVLRRVAIRFAEPYMERVEGKPAAERVAATARVIEERGCPADFTMHDGDWHIGQYTCPFPIVARSNSGVCAMEVDFVRRLTGADARLVSSLLRGDRSCTYRIRATGTPSGGS